MVGIMNRCFLPTLFIGVVGNSHAQDFRSFIGASNTVWESPTNWNPNLVPDSISEGARLDNGATVIVGGSHTISALEIQSGSLAINQTNHLVTSTLLIDSAGSITGPGTLTMNQSGTIDDVSGVLFSNVTFRNEGTLNLFNGISLGGDAVFENVHTTLLVDGSSISVGAGAGAPGQIVNTGFIRKSAGAGSATISVPIDNDLEIVSVSGTLNVTGDIDSSGQIRTEASGTIVLSGNHTFADGSSIFGDGVVRMNTGSMTIPSGANVSFDNVEVRGGQVLGDGVIDWVGTDNIWASGSIAGSVTSRIGSGAVLTVEKQGNGAQILGTHGIEVLAGGHLRFAGSDGLFTSNGMTSMTNQGLVEFAGDGDLSQNGSAANTLMSFINSPGGEVVKSASSGGNTQFIASVASSGLWRVLAGEMFLQRVADFSGPIEVAGGATLTFSGGAATPSVFRAGTNVTGAGWVEFETPMEIDGGATVMIPRLEVRSSGRIEGAGTVQIANDLLWTTGQIGGTVTVETLPGATLRVPGTGSRSIGTGSTPLFQNAGHFSITDSAGIGSNGSATVVNSGTFLLAGSGDLTRNSGTNTAFTNTGSLIKEDGGAVGSAATSLLQADLVHLGVMEVRSGLLRLFGTHTFASPVSVDSGGIFQLDGSTVATFEAGSAVVGDGIFEHRSTEITVAAGARVPFSNYTTPSGSGLVSGSGTFVIASDTVVDRMNHEDPGVTEIALGVDVVAGSNFKLSGGRVLRNLGTFTLPSSFNSTATNGAAIENEGLLVFDASCSITHGGGVFSIENPGILRCDSGGTNQVNLPADEFSGDGSLEVVSGRLNFSRPVALTGSINLSAGAQLSSSAPSLDIAAGALVSGNGTLVGPVHLDGTASPGNSIGILNVTGDLDLSGSATIAVELGNGTNDQLIVSGDLDLGGVTISPSLVSGYTPTVGDSWDVVTAGSLTGTVGLVQQAAAAPGFGFFLTTVGSQLRLTYSAVDTFQEAYESATGQSLGPNPDLSAIALGDVDGDGKADLVDWAFGGTLGGPDPGREFVIESVVDIGGGNRRVALRYPISSNADDLILSVEKNTVLSGSFTSTTFSPTGTTTVGGILFQQGTVDTAAAPDTTFFRLRAEFDVP